MKKLFYLIIAISALLCSCTNKTEMELQSIITKVENDVFPLNKEANLAYWEGTTTGNPEAFEKYSQCNVQIIEYFSDKEIFNQLKAIKESGKVKDPILLRELDVLYNNYLGNQADTSLLNAIVAKETLLEQKYADYRATFKGKPINDNRVEEILHVSTNNKDLEAVWKSHKAIGKIVAEDIVELVKLRNNVARELGFDNYHTMSLMLSGQNPEEVSALFDELNIMTKDGFASLKREMDQAFSKRYNLPIEKLMPWHYQGRFFQEAPNLYPVDLDKYYKGKNLEKLTSDFYASIGLDVSGIMANSDLYPREKKNQHAFCADMDSHGDVRILCNVTDNEQWMSTMLHEFGHGVYSLGHDIDENPLLLRESAHTFTTEAVAMLFERLSRNPEWMMRNLGISQEEKESIADNCIKSLRLQQLVFSRWTQVVYRFEKEMYSNPDQDLNKLWWDMVEEYQMLKRPEGRNEPDWASKIHIALYPCYYHNYQLGALLASQLHNYIVNNITMSGDINNDCYTQNAAAVGKWISENVFNPGMKYQWNEMIQRATGEKLTAKYYKKQFVGGEDESRGYIVKVGDKVPEFSLKMLDGTSVDMKSLKGKVVMLQFTASWCGVCRKEMPFIESDIYAKLKDNSDFALYGIDLKEDAQTIKDFAASIPVSYPITLDSDGSIFNLFCSKGAGVTRNIILDKKGKIIFLTRLFKEEEFSKMVEVINSELAK